RWVKQFGGPDNDEGYGIAATKDLVYLTGRGSNGLDLGTGAFTGKFKSNVFIAAFTPAGVAQWAKSFNRNGADWSYWITADTNANAYITGYFTAKVDFGGGDLTADGEDIFVASFDATGAHRWSKGYGSSTLDAEDHGESIAVDSQNGCVYVTGYRSGPIDFGGGLMPHHGSKDIFVVSLDATTGAHRWSKGFGSALVDWGRGISVGPAGNVYLGGFVGGAVDLGGGLLRHSGGYDVLLMSYGSDGAHRWSTLHGGPYRDLGQGIAVWGTDGVFVTGEFTGNVDFGYGPLTSANITATDVFLLHRPPGN
ncbi:MAG: hypothetical protein JRH20_28080, partial [Deltaproteobacteria bacterium]|nr:hypothetical protein [Deltaproteobacteria bacterium]